MKKFVSIITSHPVVPIYLIFGGLFVFGVVNAAVAAGPELDRCIPVLHDIVVNDSIRVYDYINYCYSAIKTRINIGVTAARVLGSQLLDTLVVLSLIVAPISGLFRKRFPWVWAASIIVIVIVQFVLL